MFIAVPARRNKRAKSTVQCDRNVRINRAAFCGPSTSTAQNSNAISETEDELPVHQPKRRRVRTRRVRVPVHRYNCGLIVCSWCDKSFRDDIPVELYDGAVVCSFDCFRKANRTQN